tara:strand:- start:132 stop:923 length:792 start_codon:yes stop_codon:yes gene_type:complete
MHVAVDDTYGPEFETASAFVTGRRRSHVAVIFPDSDVPYIREQINACLKEVRDSMGIDVNEFHFVDIFNRKPPWDDLSEGINLKLFEAFASIYSRYRWPVVIMTIDDRTLIDHGIEKIKAKIDGLNLEKPEDLSLFWLFIKLKSNRHLLSQPLNLIVDEGRRKPGSEINKTIFHDWQADFKGWYASSKEEPLLQLADFLAYCINRCTHLSMKEPRKEIDNWFLNLVGSMKVNSEDLRKDIMKSDFSVKDFDRIHQDDRAKKGL